jgi:HIT domain
MVGHWLVIEARDDVQVGVEPGLIVPAERVAVGGEPLVQLGSHQKQKVPGRRPLLGGQVERRGPVNFRGDAEDLGARVFRTGHRLARALRRSGLPCEGVNMFLADGEAAFQEVFHVHLHVFPRTVGDGFVIDARWRFRDRGELDASAEQVRRGLRALSS